MHTVKARHTLPINNMHPKLKADTNIQSKSVGTHAITMLFA
jgi:hypothetical protein